MCIKQITLCQTSPRL